jgi:hypothetical protein
VIKEGNEENIVEGDEEVGSKENFEWNKEDYNHGNARMNDDAMHGHGVRGINPNILGRLDMNGEELNVILWMLLGFFLQKVVWLYSTHKNQFLMIKLGRTYWASHLVLSCDCVNNDSIWKWPLL